MITNKNMDGILEYISSPDTIISFVIFVFWLWATWSNLNWRIKQLEKKTEEIDISKIEAKLAEISTDLQWIKMELKTKVK